MQEWYLWYDQLPAPDPAGFDSPEAYLQAVRYRPLDTSYSYIGEKAAVDAFFSDSQFIGLGVSYRQTSATQLRVAQVYAGSPAATAGLRRGDFLVAIGGTPVADLLRTGGVGDAFGPSEVGVSVSIAWRTPGGQERQATLTKALVTIPTVSSTRVLDNGGARVGYVFFRNFVTPSTEALNVAFDRLLAEGATDLVLDLRYNGGGLVDVAQHLGGLIGGQGTAGEVFLTYRHNDKNSSRNETVRFESKPNALDLPRLVVITTGGSASASELIINSLRPFMTVTVVGVPDLREAGRSVRVRLLREGPLPGRVRHRERPGGGGLLRRHTRRLPGPRRPEPPARRARRGLPGRGTPLPEDRAVQRSGGDGGRGPGPPSRGHPPAVRRRPLAAAPRSVLVLGGQVLNLEFVT